MANLRVCFLQCLLLSYSSKLNTQLRMTLPSDQNPGTLTTCTCMPEKAMHSLFFGVTLHIQNFLMKKQQQFL